MQRGVLAPSRRLSMFMRRRFVVSTTSSRLGLPLLAFPQTLSLPPFLHHNARFFYQPSGIRLNTSSAANTSKASSTKKASDSGKPLETVLPNKDTKNVSVYRVVKHVLRHLWPKDAPTYRALVVASVLCVVVAKVLKVAVPFWFKMIVDSLTPAGAKMGVLTVMDSLQLGVFAFVAAYGISRLTASVTEELKSALFAPVGAHASTTITMEMIQKLHSLDLPFHLSRETGVVSKDIDRGSRAFWSLAYALLFMIIPTAFEVALVCTVLQGSAGLSFILIALSAVGSYIGWTYLISNWRSTFRDRYNKAESRAGGLIVDSLLNYETVKYFGREAHEGSRIRLETEKMNRDLMRLDQSMSLLNFGQQAIFVCASVSCLYLSTCAVLAGTMTVGDMVLVDALLIQLYTPLSFLGILYREIQSSTQNMQAMIALLDLKSAVTERTDAQPLQLTDGTIELRNVCFSMDGRQILKNISLTIPGGSTVAFVGPSGSGKSTIFRLLYRFYDPTSGDILLDGQSLPSLQLQSFRSAVGVIPQDTVLFNDSVRYNIRYGRLGASDEEVEEAARLADIHDSIMRMSHQYDTAVGERGLKLSGGEKQRVAIARVLLENAPILLADEATSALDTTTEMRVMEQMQRAMPSGKKRTIVLIAHHLKTVIHANIIFVLDGKGGIAEWGTHGELLGRGGLYSELWRLQPRDACPGEVVNGVANMKSGETKKKEIFLE